MIRYRFIKNDKGRLELKRAFFTSLFYLIFGLAFGVFYREYTRMADFEGSTALSFVHPHILTLGFIFFLVIIILIKSFNIDSARYNNTFYYLYNTGLLISIFAMIYRGMLDVAGLDSAYISYVAGAGHIILAAGLGFFARSLYVSIKKK